MQKYLITIFTILSQKYIIGNHPFLIPVIYHFVSHPVFCASADGPQV